MLRTSVPGPIPIRASFCAAAAPVRHTSTIIPPSARAPQRRSVRIPTPEEHAGRQAAAAHRGAEPPLQGVLQLEAGTAGGPADVLGRGAAALQGLLQAHEELRREIPPGGEGEPLSAVLANLEDVEAELLAGLAGQRAGERADRQLASAGPAPLACERVVRRRAAGDDVGDDILL